MILKFVKIHFDVDKPLINFVGFPLYLGFIIELNDEINYSLDEIKDFDVLEVKSLLFL